MKDGTIMVRVLWGNPRGVIQVGKTTLDRAMALGREFFQENDHFFHLEHFPPYNRMWWDADVAIIDYGSWTNFIYCIPVK